MIKDNIVISSKAQAQGELMSIEADIFRLMERRKELIQIIGTMNLLEQKSVQDDSGNTSSED